MHEATVPPGTDDPAHLCDARLCIGHEVDDELRERCVEAVVRPRERFCAAEAYVRPGHSLRAGTDELLGRIDGRKLSGVEEIGKCASQRAGPAADIEHSCILPDVGKPDQRRRKANGVPAHVAVVRVAADLEAHALGA